MSFSPVAFIAPNYRDYKNYWLKFYEPSTTTPKAISLDGEGLTQVAKLQLNIDGFVVSAGGAIVMPYVNSSYDGYLFPTEAEADNNDTANAIRVADDITGVSGAILANSVVTKFDTLQDVIDEKSTLLIYEGAALNLAGRNSKGDGGGAMWDVIAGATFPTSSYVVNHNTLPLQLVLRIEPVMYASQFGIKFDGSDESSIFSDILDFQIATGVIIDGENKQVRVANTYNLSPTFTFSMENWKFITGNDYTDQCNISLDTDVEVRLNHIHVDGERNTRAAGTEPWSVFSNLGGVDSIQPLGVGRFFRTLAYGQEDIHLNNLKFTNYHGAECVKINSYATVFINNFKAEFCSNKTFHVWHSGDEGSDPGTGVTIAGNIDTRDCGIMVENFLVDGVAKTRADNYAPQGAFGAIVTFGRYILSNVYARNYGATAVTGDRNKVFEWSNIEIFHNDPNAFSNNPSGAMWNESCNKEVGSNLNVFVSARDPRETSIDNSLLQAFLGDGEISEITNVILETTEGSNINKVLRGSHGAGSAQTVNGYSIEATGSNSAVVIANVSGQSNKVALHNGRVRGGDVEVRDSLDATITNLDSTGLLTLKAVVALPIGNVTLDNVNSGNLAIDGCGGDIKINNCAVARLRMSSTFGSSFNELTVGGGTRFTSSNSIITGGKTVKFGDVNTRRRVQFTDCETVSVNGGEYKTNIAEPILWFSPTAPGIMIRAAVNGCSIWIQTGTVGAGYTQFDANVGSNYDAGNDKATIAYT